MTEINVVDILAIIGWIYGLVSMAYCMIIKKFLKLDIDILTEKNKLLSKEYANCMKDLLEARENIENANKGWWKDEV